MTSPLARFGLIARLAAVWLIAIGSAGVIAAPAVHEWKTVRIGIDPQNPPFSALDIDRVAIGFDVAIANALCERMKVKCDLVPQSRAMLIADLVGRKTDAVVASLVITDEGRKSVDFTDRYAAADARFITTETSTLVDASPDSLRGKSVGALANSRFATYLTEIYAPKGTLVRLYKTDAEAYADLANGKISAVIGGSVVLYRWFETGSGGRCCRFLGPAVRSSKFLGDGAGIAIRKEDAELRDLFNRALADILRDGTYEKINATYFHFLIY